MADAVYVLCAAACLACTVLLIRGYLRTRTRLLLWSSLCFLGLTLNNLLLVADKIVFVEVNLAPWRTATALAGLLVLLYGLIWDAEGRSGR